MSSIAIIVLLGASGIFAQQQQHQQLQPQETDRLPPSWQDFFEKKETEFIAKESGEVLPPPIPASAFALLPAQEVTWLNLHSRGVDDTAMEKYISKFPLTRLILQKGVNDKSLTQLNSLKNLVSLSLKDSREVNGSAFEELQLPKLQHLDLESVPITDEALVSISRNYPSLVTLVLTATKIKGTTLGELKQLKQLKNLQLRALSIPENDLDRLTDMPSLEAITISANPLLTESAIRKLCLHNKAITSVTVQDIYHIPEETFDRLRAEFKGTVSFDSHRRKDYDPLPEDTMKDILDADTSP